MTHRPGARLTESRTTQKLLAVVGHFNIMLLRKIPSQYILFLLRAALHANPHCRINIRDGWAGAPAAGGSRARAAAWRPHPAARAAGPAASPPPLVPAAAPAMPALAAPAAPQYLSPHHQMRGPIRSRHRRVASLRKCEPGPARRRTMIGNRHIIPTLLSQLAGTFAE